MTLLVLLPLLLCACTVSRVEPLSVPLTYTHSPKDAGMVAALSCNVPSQIQVSDARSSKTLGLRVHESRPLTAEVTAGNDPSTWVQDGLQKVRARSTCGNS